MGALAPTCRPHQHIKDSRGFLCFSLRLFAILKDVNDDGVLVNVVRIFQLPKETSSPVFRAKEGNSLTTDKGMTLYSFSCTESEAADYLPCDDPGDAAVYWSALCGDAKECSRRWRLYRPAPGARPSGEFTIEDVSDPTFLDPAGTTAPSEAPKVKAWAYRGKPLYTFVDDDEPGQILGDWINYFARSSFDAVLVPGPGLY